MDLSQLDDRLATIESRLSKIEGRLNMKESVIHSMPSSSIQSPTIPPLSTPPKNPPAKSGSWLGIIAVICFVFAAGFIIKLSIESGWLTPLRQICLASLFGLSLISGGFVMYRFDKEYSSLLPGAGIIILYLSIFAAHSYYALMSFEMSLAAISIVSGLCILLYMDIRHDAYAFIASAGSYLVPLMLLLNTTAVFTLYYFICCSLTFSIISIWVRSRTLTMISAYLAILTTSFVGFDLKQNDLIAIILFLHFLIYSVGAYLFTKKTHQLLTKNESWSFFPVLVLFYAMEYYFIDQNHPTFAPWCSLAFAALLICLYTWVKKEFINQTPASQPVILAFTTLVCFHSIYLELLPPDTRPWLFVAILLGFSFFPLKWRHQQNVKTFFIPLLALYLIVGIEYLSMLFHLLGDYQFSWILVASAAFASMWVMLLYQSDYFSNRSEYSYIWLGAAHLLGISGLYQLTTDYGSLAVTATWLLYAIAVMGLAFFRHDKIMAKSAFFILAFAAGKALLYDASSAPTGVRIFCLLLTGIVLYGSGFLFRKIETWKKL